MISIAATAVFAIATLLAIRARARSISALRRGLARSWTNEADTAGRKYPCVDLDLRLAEGDLVGQVTSKAADRPFEAHVRVGWARATLEVFELRRRSLARVGRARLRLIDNRLDWCLVGHRGESVLPKRTELWPNPRRPSRLRFRRYSSH